MDDPGWRVRGYPHEFEHRAAGVRSNDQEAFLSQVVVLDETDGVPPRVLDVDIGDAVLPGAVADVRGSTLR